MHGVIGLQGIGIVILIPYINTEKVLKGYMELTLKTRLSDSEKNLLRLSHACNTNEFLLQRYRSQIFSEVASAHLPLMHLLRSQVQISVRTFSMRLEPSPHVRRVKRTSLSKSQRNLRSQAERG